MPRPLRIGVSLAAVLAAYAAYRLAAVPWIEPAAGRWQSDEEVVFQPPADRLAGLKDLFQPGDWELDERTKILESDQVKLLWRDLTDAGGGQMELVPCTMIFTPNGASAVEAEQTREAIVLQAPQGALLTFDRPLDLRKGEVGRLKAGQLRGRIIVRSQGKLPGPEDDLYLVTRDVELTEQRLWTPNDLEFSWGRSTGRGTHLEVKFSPGDRSRSAQKHGMNIGSVEWIEVRRLERLRLDLGSPASPSGKQPAPGDRAGTSWTDIPFEITCRGPVRFDPGEQSAVFRKQVDLLRVYPNGESDQINGEMLAVYFGRRRDAAVPPGDSPQPAPAKARSPVAGLQPRRIEAQGHPVIVRAPSQDAQARGDRLEYDLQTGHIVLDGDQGAFLRQGNNEIHAPHLEYQLGQQGGLGQAAADGPGSIRAQLPGRTPQPFEARWTRQLLLRPQDQQHVISLLGSAELNYGILGGLSAGEIHFWLQEAPPSGPGQQPQVLPDRMLARQDVQFASAKLSGKVNELRVWFKPVPPGRQQQPGGERSPLARQLQDPSVRLAMELAARVPAPLRTVWLPTAAAGQPLAIPGAPRDGVDGWAPVGTPAGAAAGQAVPPLLAQHFQIEGKVLEARVTAAGTTGELSELIVEGNVRLAETQTSQPGEKPILMSGDRIQVVDASKPTMAATVTGSPAHVEGRGLSLNGANIHLNCGTNQLRIDGQGRMELPLDRDFQGRPVRNQGPLVILWQERMVLDGRTARFEGSVVAAVQEQRLLTDTLEVSFTEPIRLADMKNQPRPEIEKVLCRGKVFMEGRELEGSEQVSYERMQTSDLEIETRSGAVRAGGPGRATTVRRELPGMAQTLPGRRPPAEPPAADGPKPLSCLDIRFQGGITGNLYHRALVFHNQVKTIYTTVAKWDAVPETDNPERLGPNGVVLTCDRLSAVQTPIAAKTGRSWDLAAEENAVVEGQSFTARAARVSYAQAKGLLTIEGDGRNDAVLSLQEHPGERPSEIRSQQILYWPDTKQRKLGGFRSLEINDLLRGEKKK